jgi:hypothetical protein
LPIRSIEEGVQTMHFINLEGEKQSTCRSMKVSTVGIGCERASSDQKIGDIPHPESLQKFVYGYLKKIDAWW